MLVQTAIIIFAYFVVWYLLAAAVKNASIVDIGWGFGFVVVAWAGFVQNITVASAVSTLLVTIWGLRLTYHVFRRNHKKPEDFRYAAFRRDWGRWYYLRSFFQLFMFQGVVMFAVSLGFIYINKLGSVNSLPLFIAGVIVWIAGFLLEAVSDSQLRRFASAPENKGRIIDTGLWRYSRHPNYFGEAVAWWGIFLMALSVSAPWFTVISPLAITLIIRYVSGVPMLERRLEKREGFEKYKNNTSIFIPWFPKGEK